MHPASPPELGPLRRETVDGLEIASDRAEREHETDFVLGAGPASRLLARLTIRRHASAVLDLGTGSGVQALLASRHADRVVAVDVNSRALAVGELNARSNGIVNVEWREGSWLEPVRGERFDLVISNPPYVISPDSNHSYRDSGEHMDALVLRLLGEVPRMLEEGGFAQVLCNWVVGADRDWRSTIETAVSERGCDAILIRYSLEEPAAYAERWHERLANVDPHAHKEAIDRWVAHYADNGVEALAFGIVVLRRRQAERNWFAPSSLPGLRTTRPATTFSGCSKAGTGCEMPPTVTSPWRPPPAAEFFGASIWRTGSSASRSRRGRMSASRRVSTSVWPPRSLGGIRFPQPTPNASSAWACS